MKARGGAQEHYSSGTLSAYVVEMCNVVGEIQRLEQLMKGRREDDEVRISDVNFSIFSFLKDLECRY